MPIRNLDDIVCYEIGSDVAAPWEGTHSSLHGDIPALEIYARRGLIRLEINGGSVSISGATRVGLVILPSGRRLIIRSKISGLTILEWLAYLGEFRPLQRWLPEKGIAAKDTEQDDWYRCIGRLFLAAMEDELAGTGWRRVSNAEHTRRWDDPASRDDPTRWLNADVILKKLETRWVLDAKYKREFGNEGRTDRFQMCAYAIGFDANRVSLVYPIATTNGGCHRTILTATMGERVVQIDSIALPMSEGPQACLRRLARTMTIC